MEQEKPYICQYIDIVREWRERSINIRNASKQRADKLRDVRAKALSQSGLSANELEHICMCRLDKTFVLVNTCAHSLKWHFCKF